MKALLAFLGIIIALALIGSGVWWFMSPKTVYKADEVVPSAPFVLAPDTYTPDTTTVPGVETKESIEKEFEGSFDTAERFSVLETAVMGPYALTSFADENTGGMALFRYENGAWVFVANDGGAFGTDTLVQLGVPQATAIELLKALY